MITDVRGVRAGHWTDAVGRTGCTVVLFPEATVASGEVRGGAPGTREWALLEPGRLVSRIDAAVLCGGSAFGLAACDGVVRWCEERGLGLPTPAGPVPIVVGTVLFDLAVGDPGARPREADGYAACVAATSGQVASGLVGAGCGATIGKWRGIERISPGGLGSATARIGELVVSAIVAVNAWGDLRRPAAGEDGGVDDGLRRLLATGRDGPAEPAPAAVASDAGLGGGSRLAGGQGTNTTIGVIATNARLDKVECSLVAKLGHDGLARALEPVHATFDGDALVAAATGEMSAPVDVVAILAARAVEHAIRAAVG